MRFHSASPPWLDGRINQALSRAKAVQPRLDGLFSLEFLDGLSWMEAAAIVSRPKQQAPTLANTYRRRGTRRSLVSGGLPTCPVAGLTAFRGQNRRKPLTLFAFSPYVA